MIQLARLYLLATIAAASWVAWHHAGPFLTSEFSGTTPLAHSLGRVGMLHPEVITGALAVTGAFLELFLVTGAAFVTGWFGRRQPIALIVAAGSVAYGLGLGFVGDAPLPTFETAVDVQRLIVIFALQAATLAFPKGYRTILAGAFGCVWVGASWLLVYPVGLPWDAPPVGLRLGVQLGLLSVGMAWMVGRFLHAEGAARAKIGQVLVGVGFAIVGLALRVGLPPGGFAELHAIIGYPLLGSVAPIMVALAVAERGLWDLPELTRRGALVAFVGILWLMAVLVALPGLELALGPLGVSPLITSVLGLMVASGALVWSRRWIVSTHDALLFPRLQQRAYIAERGAMAIDDATDADELRWALLAAVQQGWGKAHVTIWQADCVIVDAGDPVNPVSTDAVLGQRFEAALVHNQQAVGRLQVEIHAPRGLSSQDRESMTQWLAPAAHAVWRIAQHTALDDLRRDAGDNRASPSP